MAPAVPFLTLNVSPPALSAPSPNQSVSGIVTFAWLPTGPLPPGAAYEVVWWNPDEPAESARGIAPPTMDTQLSADLAPLYAAGQFRSSQVYWSVIVVVEGPYRRLVSPADAEQGILSYSPPGVDSGAPPPPEPPKG